MTQQPENSNFPSIAAQRQIIKDFAKRLDLPEPIFFEDVERSTREENIDIDTTETEGNNK